MTRRRSVHDLRQPIPVIREPLPGEAWRPSDLAPAFKPGPTRTTPATVIGPGVRK